MLLHPETSIEEAKLWIEKINTSFRIYKNTIILNSPNLIDFRNCLDLIQKKLAINHLKQNFKEYFPIFNQNNSEDLEYRLKSINADINFKILSMYSTVIIGGKYIDLGYPINTDISITKWIKESLIKRELILNKIHPRVIFVKFLKNHEKINTKEILNYLLKSPDLFMIESSSVLKKTIKSGIMNGIFGLGSFNEDLLLNSDIKINENMNLNSITFSETEFLVNPNCIDKFTENSKTISKNGEKHPSQENKIKNYLFRAENIDSKVFRQIAESLNLHFLENKDSLNLNLEIGIKSKIGEKNYKLAKKIKETLIQLGVNIVKEEIG